jgi:hypothetical protein
MYSEDNNVVYVDGMIENLNFLQGNGKRFRKKYGHPLWSKKNRKYHKFGHGGMDWFVMRACIETVKHNAYPPIDVYDTATYMAITALSEKSLEQNSSTVEFPDFTNGKWQKKDISKILPKFLLDY